jgi:Xaa-Pro dipeptidase
MAELPSIPAEEFAARQQKLRELLVENEIDLLIAYADDRSVFGQQHTRYLFDYQPHFEPACAFFPAEGEPFVVTGPESEEFAYATSYCRKVHVADAFTHPEEEYPYTVIHGLEEIIDTLRRELSRPLRKVALAGAELVPHRVWTALEKATGAELVDGEELVLSLRAIKSAAEISVIKYAYKIAEAGVNAAVSAIRVGVTERDVAAEAEYAMRKMGSEGMGIDTIVGCGKAGTYAILTRASLREIGAGEHVLLTIAPRYQGYHAAIGRVAVIGEASSELEQAMEVAVSAQSAAREALKPGVTGAEVDETARRVVREAGLGRHFAYSGIHSVGVAEFEPPILSSRYHKALEPDMVFSVDIPLFFLPWGGLRCEDGFLVGAVGEAEPLQTFQRGLIHVDR